MNHNLNTSDKLTSEQKIKDFLYLYDVFNNNYPFLGVCIRKHGYDWLIHKNEFISEIEKTNNDSEFINTLGFIIRKLNDGHVNLNYTRYGNEGYYNSYKKAAKSNKRFDKWVSLYESKTTRIKYWSEILKGLEENNRSTAAVTPYSHKENKISWFKTKSKEIAVISIPSFNSYNFKSDSLVIETFLNQISDCKYLIINIQDNCGGSAQYWRDLLVKRLISIPVTYTNYPVIKDGTINRFFYNDFFNNSIPLVKTDNLTKIPDEFLNHNFHVKFTEETIIPDKSVNFKGKIFLLVNKVVFSASEGFAQFCKTTGWAKVAGERTGGDGIGSDPAIILLPESGIILCYPSLVGLNHDGSINSEVATVPDLEITGSDSQDRLEKLINFLED